MDIGLSRALGRVAGLRVLAGGGGARQYWQQLRAIFGASIVAGWNMDEPSGAAARDFTGGGHNATCGGGYTRNQAGQFGLASTAFDGTGYLNILANPLTGFSGNEGFISMCVSASYANWNAATHLFRVGSSQTNCVLCRKSATGLYVFFRRVGSTLPSVTFETPATDRWVHLAFVWSVAGPALKIYVNGTRRRIQASAQGTPWSGALSTTVTALMNGAVGGIDGLPGRMQYAIVGSGIPTDQQIWQASRSTAQVIVDGDSRSADKLWPAAAMEAAFPAGAQAFGGRGCVSYGVSGQTVQTMLANAASTIDPLLKSGHNTIVLWGGVNDGSYGGRSAAQIYADIRSYCLARKAAGWQRVICCSEIDMQADDLTWHNTIWPALNTLLYADHSFADAMIDLAADARLQNALDTTFFNADKVHLNAAGGAVVAEIAAPVLAAIA